MPFLYARPERFRIGAAPPPGPVPDARFTVDTAEDLAFVRQLAERLGDVETASLTDLSRILDEEPGLAATNQGIRQKTWHEVDLA
jgi:spore coat polysaccharide biosynthesis protein SpsF